jgi:hypothetical protein
VRVRILDEAKAEVDWAVGSGEPITRGQGERLYREYLGVIEWAQQFPHSGSPIAGLETEQEARGFLLGARLPFTAVIVIAPDELVVVALAHHKQEPGYWKGRLKDV